MRIFLRFCWPFVFVLFLLAPAASAAESAHAAQRSLAFSKLVLRTNHDQLLVSDAQSRIQIIEYLRGKGLNVLGAESVVFNQDKSESAELVLGGTVRSIECAESLLFHCLVGVEWELFDVHLDQVVYRAQVWGEFHGKRHATLGRQLILQSLDRLLDKLQVQHLLRKPGEEEVASSDYESATLARCSQDAVPIETGADHSLDAVAIVSSGSGFGSGFFISDGPFVLTAAHVVHSGRSMLTFRNGHKSKASLIRIDRKADVALLRVDSPPDAHSCLQPASSAGVRIGASAYVLGSPASQELSFSLSRGILSGVRELAGVRQLQTDAAVSPGNSGGPLVDGEGRVLGVTSWKIVGGGVEGLGFAISMQDALSRLNLTLGEESEQELLEAPAVVRQERQVEAKGTFVEPPDPKPELIQEDVTRRAKNVVYFEGLGAAILYSVNYERIFAEDFSARVGATFMPYGAGGTFAMPVGLNWFGLGGIQHRLEIAGGVVFANRQQFANSTSPSGFGLSGYAGLGYRYQPLNGGFFFRAGVLAQLGSGSFPVIPWPHAALGGTF